MNQTQKEVKKYYGEELQSTEDLKTSACCPIGSMPRNIQPYIKNIHADVLAKFYGCGSPIPPALEGQTVLDLGCGTGRDCYILSQMVGEKGHVIGIDMTEEQLEVARKYLPWHMEKFGYKSTNITFHKSYIEKLEKIEDASVDVIISNCVINLSTDKEAVFKEMFRVLKKGGEIYFSDVYADRRISQELQDDPVLFGECLSGALYVEDFRRMLHAVGFADYRTMSCAPVAIEDDKIKEKLGNINFSSITVRTFKCDFEDICENYGHTASYQGEIPENEQSFILDDHHIFKAGVSMPICGNTAKMLSETRYAPYFKVEGDFSTHLGVFDCIHQADCCAPTTDTGSCC